MYGFANSYDNELQELSVTTQTNILYHTIEKFELEESELSR